MDPMLRYRQYCTRETYNIIVVLRLEQGFVTRPEVSAETVGESEVTTDVFNNGFQYVSIDV